MLPLLPPLLLLFVSLLPLLWCLVCHPWLLQWFPILWHASGHELAIGVPAIWEGKQQVGVRRTRKVETRVLSWKRGDNWAHHLLHPILPFMHTPASLLFSLIICAHSLSVNQSVCRSSADQQDNLMSVYVCVYVWENVHVYARMCVCTHVYIYVYLSVCLYVCMYVCVYAWMYVLMCVCVYKYIYVRMHVGMYVCMFVCMYVCIYTCLYVYMYVCVCARIKWVQRRGS